MGELYVLPWGQMSFWGEYLASNVDEKKLSDKFLGKLITAPHPEDLLSIFYGTLLGDSHIEKRINNVRISFQQENSNVEYLMWLWGKINFHGYCTDNKPTLKIRLSSTGKIRHYYKFHTFTSQSLNYIYNEFYWDNSNKKRVPKEIEKYLTPLALACWVMDDGAKVGKGFKFCTNGFLKEDIEILAKALWNRYQIETSIQKTGAEYQWILYIPVSNMDKFRNIVKNHMVKSMWYKISA